MIALLAKPLAAVVAAVGGPLALIVAAAIVVVGAYLGGRITGKAACEVAQAQAERDQATELSADAIARARDTTEIEVRYVDRVQTVERAVPVVRDRLVRGVCHADQDRGGSPLPATAGTAAGGPHADAGDRRSDLAADLIACRTNAERHRALIEAVIANGGAQP